MNSTELRDRLERRLNELSPRLLEVVLEFVEFLAQRQQVPSETTAPPPAEDDPLIGIFSGSPNLATDAEEILEQDAIANSGWTWKQP